MIAAPRCWTPAMNSPSSHASSSMTSGAGRPPIVACHASGNWVEEWLPQMARSRTARHRHAGLRRQLRAAAALVEHGHREPSVARHAVARSRGGADERVRVARVADDQHAAVVGRVACDRLALPGEDAAVDAEQVLALHPLPARHGADEERPVGTGEGLIGVGRADHRVEQRKRAVVELHAHAVEGGQRRGKLEELEPHRSFRARTSGPMRSGRAARSRSGRRRRSRPRERGSRASVSCRSGDRLRV